METWALNPELISWGPKVYLLRHLCVSVIRFTASATRTFPFEMCLQRINNTLKNRKSIKACVAIALKKFLQESGNSSSIQIKSTEKLNF